jgi:hypothetical protein
MEDEKTRPRVTPSAEEDAAAPPAAEGSSPKAVVANPADPTLSGTSLTGPQPKRSQRVVLLALGGALAFGAAVFALTRPPATPEVPPTATVPAVEPPLAPEPPHSAPPPVATSAPTPETSAAPAASAAPIKTSRKPPIVVKPPPPVVTTAKPVETAPKPGRPIRTLDEDNPFGTKP